VRSPLLIAAVLAPDTMTGLEGAAAGAGDAGRPGR